MGIEFEESVTRCAELLGRLKIGDCFIWDTKKFMKTEQGILNLATGRFGKFPDAASVRPVRIKARIEMIED